MLIGGVSLGAILLAMTLGAWGLTTNRYERRDHYSYTFIPHMRYIAMQKLQRLKAVDGIDFQVGKDESVGLVGESGSGKTVTGLSVFRIVPQPGKIVSGSITF